MKKRTQQGVTLYELLITLLVVGVVMALGIPNFQDFTANSRITATANDLHAAFQLARTEAARAKTNVTICASSDPFAADADCDGTWDQGYIVYEDSDATIGRTAGDLVIRTHGPIERDVVLAVADDATFFSFAGTGLGRGDVGGNSAVSQVVVCDDRGNVVGAGGNSAARLFVTTPLGRATIVRDRTAIGTALTNMSKSCP